MGLVTSPLPMKKHYINDDRYKTSDTAVVVEPSQAPLPAAAAATCRGPSQSAVKSTQPYSFYPMLKKRNRKNL